MGCNCQGGDVPASFRARGPERMTVQVYCFDDPAGNEVCSQNWSGFTIRAQKLGVRRGRIVQRTYLGAELVEERLMSNTSTGV